MTNDEAIKELQGMLIVNRKEIESIDMAIEALKRREPMETAPEELGITAMSPIIIPCGNCGMELTDRMWFFCPWCGQKIKWIGKST